MSFRASRVTVTTDPTVILALSSWNPENVVIRNRSTVSVFLGGSTVTTATGYELDADDSVAFQLRANESVYGVVAAATARVDLAHNDGISF